MAEFINKIKTSEGTQYDIQDKRVDELPPIPTEAEIDLKVDAAKSRVDGNSLVIPEQPAPEPVITIDGVAYFHKQEFDLEALAAEHDGDKYYDVLTGSVTEHSGWYENYPFVRGYFAGLNYVSLFLFTSEGSHRGVRLYGAETTFVSRAFIVVNTQEEVTDDTKICLPTCSAYYGFLSEDGKTFISYYNLKGEGAPEYIDSVKQGNAVAKLKDVRLPDATAADVGKVLAVNAQGELVLQQVSGGGTKLYQHAIYTKNSAGDSLIRLYVYNNILTAYTKDTFIEVNLVSCIGGNVNGAPLVYCANNQVCWIKGDGTISSHTVDSNPALFEDTVTEL